MVGEIPLFADGPEAEDQPRRLSTMSSAGRWTRGSRRLTRQRAPLNA
jgi:hypothetical protein